jgi:hypothetical protein
MGTHKVALKLRDGRLIDHVVIAWGREVLSVNGEKQFELPVADIVAVIDRS